MECEKGNLVEVMKKMSQKIKLRSFKSSEHINEKGRGPYPK